MFLAHKMGFILIFFSRQHIFMPRGHFRNPNRALNVRGLTWVVLGVHLCSKCLPNSKRPSEAMFLKSSTGRVSVHKAAVRLDG
jgi:hypothetical protein